MAPMAFTKLVSVCLIVFVDTSLCDLTTREVFDVLNNKINNLQFEFNVYTADIGSIKETLGRLEKQVGKNSCDCSTDIETRGSDGIAINSETPTQSDNMGTMFDVLVTRVHKTLSQEKRISRNQIHSLTREIDDNKNDLKSEMREYMDTISEDLLAVKLYQNTSLDRLRNRIGEMEDDMQEMNYRVGAGREKTDDVATELRLAMQNIESRRWEAWGAWGDCTWNCTPGTGGRVQSRSRTRPCGAAELCDRADMETESRPCNAVQFAGCIQSTGSPDNYAVSYDFADQMAQATCTALKNGYVSAVRRACYNTAPDCNAVCRSTGRSCFNALHVYRSSPVLQRSDVGKSGLKMYRYDGCSGNICGPNFCCCSGI